jgi:hypothetical protein
MSKNLIAAVLAALPVVAAAERPRAGAEAAVRTARIATIDHPAVTGLTEDGRRVSFKVPRRQDVAGLKVGDELEIVVTEALLISVE